jgi:hypothetical protein
MRLKVHIGFVSCPYGHSTRTLKCILGRCVRASALGSDGESLLLGYGSRKIVGESQLTGRWVVASARDVKVSIYF